VTLGLPHILLVVAALVVLAVAFTAGREAQTARRVILPFLFRIALPVAVILGVPLVLLSQFVDLNDRLWQALIAGLVIATGWLTSALFAELGKARARAERLRDYHKAIYAEIGNTLHALYAGEDAGEEVLTRMMEDLDFVPFVPKEDHSHIYEAIVTEIDVLPRQTIDAIVAYYSLIKSVAALAEDMRGETYKSLTPERRMAIYADYTDLRKEAFMFGQYALGVIKAFSDGGADAAEAWISSQAAGRSAMSPGSE
jgi:hypothetical protein